MKRASLKVVPTAASKEPADLTDRLLDREDGQSPPKATPKRAARRPKPKTAPTEPATPAGEPTAPQPVENSSTSAATPAPSNGNSLTAALAQAQTASQALEAAAGDSPARYSVALRYRLEALAQHVRQVAEFVQRLNP